MVERQQNCHLTPAVSLGLFDLHEVWLCREIQTSADGTAGCCPFPHSDDSGRPAPLEAGSFFMACSKNAVFPGLISLGSNLSLLRNSPGILSQASSGCLGHPQFILVTGGGCFSKKNLSQGRGWASTKEKCTASQQKESPKHLNTFTVLIIK